MDRDRRGDWSRRLRPLYLGADPIDRQMERRWGVVVVVSVLFLSLSLFFVAIFAGFGHWRIGLVLAGMIVPIPGWIWWDYFRLRRTVADYLRQSVGDTVLNAPPG